MSTDLTDSPPVLAMSPMQMAYQLMQSGREVDPDIVKKFMDLERDHADRLAQREFNSCLVACQAEMKTVLFDAHNSQTNSSYTKLEGMLRQIKPTYTKYGFAPSFSEEPPINEGKMRTVVLHMHHKAGWTERRVGYYPFDTSGPKGTPNKSEIQGTKSSNTYAQRDMLRNFFAIVFVGEDNDGAGEVHYATTEQIAEINTLIEQCAAAGKPVTFDRFLKWLAVDNLENLDNAGVVKAVTELRRRLAATKKARQS